MKKPRSTQTSRVPTWLRVLIPTVLILVWFVMFGAGGASFGQISEVSSNDAAQQLPASADATKVQALESEFRGNDTLPGILIFESDTKLTDADTTAINETVTSLSTLKGVVTDSVSPVIISDDGEAAEVFLPLDNNAKPADTVEEIDRKSTRLNSSHWE